MRTRSWSSMHDDAGHARTFPRSDRDQVPLQLLMGLLANPSRLDRSSQAAQVHLGRQVGKIVFLLSGRAVLADEPSLIPWEMLLTLIPYSLGRSIGGAHTDSSKSGFQPAFRPAAPTHSSPFGIGQHVFSRHRENIWHVPLTGPPPHFGTRPNELNVDGVHLEVTRDANRPGKLARRKTLTERRAEPVTGIRQHTAKTHADRYHAIDLGQRDLRLCPRHSIVGWNSSSLQPPLIVDPTVGKE